MKKLLALVLALVMTLGLATVAANAAYPDEADIDLTEAVEVLSAVGVFQGDEKGNFAPKANLDRAAAAKLIAYLDLGEKAAEALPAVKAFNDVPASHWASKYIAYCANAGYVTGAGDGNFYPANSLTGYAFGKMILCVLGYDAQVEGFTGSAWSINVAKLMQKKDINDGVDGAASATLTREEAAQYCLNALKADVVEYSGGKGTTVTIGDTVVSTGASEAKGVEDKKNDYNGKTDNVQQLAEKLYGNDLKLTTAASDDFGRPGSKWTYTKSGKTTNIGTYGDSADYTFVLEKSLTDYKKTTALALVQDLADDDDLKYATGVTYAINGDDTATLTAMEGAIDQGAVVEVFVKDEEITAMVLYTYTMAEVTKVESLEKGDKAFDDYGATKQYTIKTYTDAKTKTELSYEYYDTLSKDKTGAQELGTLAKGDKCAVVLDAADKILDTKPVTSVEGKVTGTGTRYAKIDGTKYTTVNGFLATEDEGTFYMDPNGIIFAKDLTASVTLDDALYVVKAFEDSKTEYGTATVTTSVQVVALDGTSKNLVVGTKKGSEAQKGINTTAAAAFEGTLVSSEYDSSDKVYELTAWSATDYFTSEKIASGTTLKTSSSKAGTVRLNSDTVYVVASKDGADLEVTVKTGGINKDLDKDALTICKKSNGNFVAQYVVIPTGTDAFTSTDLIYVDGNAEYEVTKVDGSTRYTYTVYNTKGEELDIVAKTKPAAGFFKYTIDKNDVYEFTAASALTLSGAYDDEEGFVTGKVFSSFYGTLLTTTDSKFVDVETENAKFVDLRDIDDDSIAYGKRVASLDAMKSAKDKGFTVTFDMYLDDGATVIFVTNVA